MKLNRKGFTLVELLAVLTILSITMYSVTSLIRNAKEKTYATTVNEVEKAAGNYLLENGNELFFSNSSISNNENAESKCVTVQDLVDYDFLNKDVVKSSISENKNVQLTDYVYIERNKTTKAIERSIYPFSGFDAICKANIKGSGDINATFNPERGEWTKSVKVNIEYRLNLRGDGVTTRNEYLSSTSYGYKYIDNNSKILAETTRNFNDVIMTEKYEANANGTLLADIGRDDEGTLASKSWVISKIDLEGPKVALVNNQEKYVSKKVTIPLKVSDYGIGVNTGSFTKEEDIVVKVGNTTLNNDNYKIDYIANSCNKIADTETCKYNLTINNESYDGKVSIKIIEGKIEDKLGNKNAEQTLDTNIIFDNTVPSIETNTTATLLETYQILKLKCRDDGGVIGYYVGTTNPTTGNITYTPVDSLKQFETEKRIDRAAIYYLSCKDKANNVSTIPVKYWNYTLKYMLNKTDKDEGTYTTNNYAEVSSLTKTYLIGDNTSINLNNISKSVPEGSNSNKYKGISQGTPGISVATLLSSNPKVTSNTTYAFWYNRNKVKIQYHVNGGTLATSHGNDIDIEPIGTIVNNGSSIVQTFKFGAKTGQYGIYDYNNPEWINIVRNGYVAKEKEEWKTAYNRTYNQNYNYNANDLCLAKSDDCIVTLYVNWVDNVGPVIEFAMYDGNTKITDNKYYSFSNSNSLTWFKFTPKLWFKVTDSGSGVNKNVKMSYNKFGLNDTTFKTDISNNKDLTLDNNGVVTYLIDSGGYRYIRLHACDNTNNCTDKDVYFKFDNTLPNVNIKMLNGATEVEENTYYSSNSSNTLTWFKFTPTLKYEGSDSLSGMKSSATMYWNEANNGSLSQTISNTDGEVNNWSNGVITRTISSNGYRFIKLHVCDNADNCVDKNIYFKFDNVAPTIPTINNPYNNVWHNGSGYGLGLSTSENLSGVSYWQYTYDANATATGTDHNKQWITYQNSNKASFTTGNFTGERNQPVYVRACDVAGNCSSKATTKIMIDRTKPTLDFKMYNGTTLISSSGGNYYAYDSAVNSDPGAKWLEFYPNLRFEATDSNSGINSGSQVFGYNDANKENFDPSLFNANSRIDNVTSSGNTYYFSRAINSPGNRYVFFKVCDAANNCSIKHVYFKVATTVNATKYNCDLYNDSDGKNRFRMRILNVTTCTGSTCSYNKLNGLNNSYSFNNDVNNPITWKIDEGKLEDTLDDACSFEYYVQGNATLNCYNGANTNSGVKAKISSNCKKLASYRTTTTINGSRGENWYYVSGSGYNCYIDGSKLTSTIPSACTSSSSSSSSSSSEQYYVTFNANGGKFSNGSTTIGKSYYPRLYLSSVGSPSRSGCYFSGWTFNGASRTSYVDYQENGGTLYAKWSCGSSSSSPSPSAPTIGRAPSFSSCSCSSNDDCVRQAGSYDKSSFEVACAVSGYSNCAWRQIKDSYGNTISNPKWNMCW